MCLQQVGHFGPCLVSFKPQAPLGMPKKMSAIQPLDNHTAHTLAQPNSKTQMTQNPQVKQTFWSCFNSGGCTWVAHLRCLQTKCSAPSLTLEINLYMATTKYQEVHIKIARCTQNTWQAHDAHPPQDC